MAILVCHLVGASGVLVFGPVWTTLSVMLGIAAWLGWIRGLDDRPVRTAFGFFAAPYVVQVAWSGVFFRLRNHTGGLVVSAALWSSVLATIVSDWVDRRAAILLVSRKGVVCGAVERRHPAVELIRLWLSGS